MILEDSFFYLLLGLKPSTLYARRIKIENTGIEVRPVIITESARVPRSLKIYQKGPLELGLLDGGRYSIWLQGTRRDDQLARKTADAIFTSLWLVTYPFSRYPFFLWRVPVRLLRKRKFLIYNELVKLNNELPYEEHLNEKRELQIKLGEFEQYPEQVMKEVWHILPALLSNRRLFKAAHFYQNSVEKYYLTKNDIEDILIKRDAFPCSLYDQPKVQDALQNAYKAIEAIIGALSIDGKIFFKKQSDKEKFFKKLKDVGINPLEKIGIQENKEFIYEKICKMCVARNKGSAHGSTPNREITYYELMDFQKCSQHFILTAIDHHLKKGK